MGNISKMSLAALALVTLAITTVVGITVLREFANSTAIESGDVTPFITGLAIFGTFSVILAIVVVGKLVIDLVKGKGN